MTKKHILIGCGALVAIVFLFFAAGVVWLAMQPEGGVRLANEMEEYATEYLAQRQLLDGSEELLAYYDVTMSLDGSEAAIVTTRRVIYHKQGGDHAIDLVDVEDIQHRQESLIGDIIEVHSRSGQSLKVGIAPFNQGETFVNVLMKAWERNKRPDAPAEAGSTDP